MSKLIIASTNKGKLREFSEVLGSGSMELNSIDQLVDEPFDVDETESTFIGNAILKARAGSKLTGEYCLADDSGVEIEALDGRPGIYSGRYLKGEDLTDLDQSELKAKHEELVEKYLKGEKAEDYCLGVYRILEEMEGMTNRKCRFTCALVISDPNGEIVFETEQYWEGNIARAPRGFNGFGYDPIMIPNEHPDKTVAELGAELKNTLSHRAKAIDALSKSLSANQIKSL